MAIENTETAKDAKEIHPASRQGRKAQSPYSYPEAKLKHYPHFSSPDNGRFLSSGDRRIGKPITK